MGLTAGLEFAYTDMAGKKLRDFLPTGRIDWQVSRTSQLALGYNRRLVRPSLTLLNPVVLRTPFAVRQGNKDLEGLHANVFALSFTHDDPIFSWGMSLSYTMSNDGFNGIWMERDNRRIYQLGNEGKRAHGAFSPTSRSMPPRQRSSVARPSSSGTSALLTPSAWPRSIGAFSLDLAWSRCSVRPSD